MNRELPDHLKDLFWDRDFGSMTWASHRDLVISRILSCGTYEDIRWLLRKLGADELRSWMTARRGRGLEARQLRFWEVILDLSEGEVDAWLEERDGVWDRRVGR